MSAYTPITAAGVSVAEPLDMNTTRSERPVSITIEAGPLGLTVRVDYQGTLSSIPAAVERLRASGVLELVSAARSAPAPATNGKPKVERVEPLYKPDGTACCPTHMKPLQEGRYGLFCPSRAKGDEPANDKGYCSLRFVE